MRGALRVGVTAVALVASQTACRDTSAGDAIQAGVPQRDLTLESASIPTIQVASPIELSRSPVQARYQLRQVRVAATRRSAVPAPRPLAVAEVAPASVPAAVAPAPLPSAEAVEPMSGPGLGRELAPGKTVTVIPAASGPSPTPSDLPDLPARAEGRAIFVGGGGSGMGGSGMGGGCRGRGPDGLTSFRLRRSPG